METLQQTKQVSIYGLDTKGNVKVKTFHAEDDKFITRYGRLSGKMTPSIKQCHDKNIGKANESLANDQAIQMVGRGVKKDTEQNGYSIVPEHIVLEGEGAIAEFLLTSVVDDTPMLAYPYKKEKADYKRGILASRKLDGIRCVAIFRNGKLKLQSRKQKPIDTMPHIVKELEPVMRAVCVAGGIDELRLDGELYNHDYRDDFEELVSAVKKYQPGVSELLQYNIYGIIDFELCALDRYGVQKMFFNDLDTCKVVEQIEVSSYEELMVLHKQWTSEGYEGAMALDAMSLYEQKRSYNLMKVKEFITEEFKIVDVVGMDARPDLAMMVLEVPEKGTFRATPKCDETKKAWYLQNRDQIIGKQGTVQYFSYTKSGMPRLPVFLTVRDYE